MLSQDIHPAPASRACTLLKGAVLRSRHTSQEGNTHRAHLLISNQLQTAMTTACPSRDTPLWPRVSQKSPALRPS